MKAHEDSFHLQQEKPETIRDRRSLPCTIVERSEVLLDFEVGCCI
jgi:hypothetical protein